MKNLGQQIRLFRTKKGIGLNEYAQQLGVSAGYLSNLETGKTDTIQLALLDRLFQELNLIQEKDSTELDDTLSLRIQRVHQLLLRLQNSSPEAAEYLITQMEQGLNLFLHS